MNSPSPLSLPHLEEFIRGNMPRLICHYHAVWATKHRAPVITPALEKIIFATLQKTSSDLKCPIHALNGWTDHIHVAVEIHHTLSVSEWMKRVKGASARAVNVQMPDLETPFYWQIGYSVQTFSLERLAGIVSYIEKQKTHHQDQTLLSVLESLDDTEG